MIDLNASWKNFIEFLNENWKAIVEFFDKLWAFAKDTILKDDSIFGDLDETLPE